MAERAIGLLRHACEIGIGDGAAGEAADHLGRDLGIGLPGEAGDLIGCEARPRFRNVQAAVTGETREHHLDEIERGSLAPR